MRAVLLATCCFTLLCPSFARAASRVLLSRIGPARAAPFPSPRPVAAASGPCLPPLRWIVIRPGRQRAAGSPLRQSATGRPIFVASTPTAPSLQRLTDNPAYLTIEAAFSPDEKQIVAVSSRADGYANLWLLDLASGKQHAALTTGQGGDFRPAWSPDGQWIVLSSDRDSDLPSAKGRWEELHIAGIFLIHPDGSGLKRLTPARREFLRLAQMVGRQQKPDRLLHEGPGHLGKPGGQRPERKRTAPDRHRDGRDSRRSRQGRA